MELLLCGTHSSIGSISLIYFCVFFLAVNVGLFPLRAASSALSAAQAHSWVRHLVHKLTMQTHSVTSSDMNFQFLLGGTLIVFFFRLRSDNINQYINYPLIC